MIDFIIAFILASAVFYLGRRSIRDRKAPTSGSGGGGSRAEPDTRLK